MKEGPAGFHSLMVMPFLFLSIGCFHHHATLNGSIIAIKWFMGTQTFVHQYTHLVILRYFHRWILACLGLCSGVPYHTDIQEMEIRKLINHFVLFGITGRRRTVPQRACLPCFETHSVNTRRFNQKQTKKQQGVMMIN